MLPMRRTSLPLALVVLAALPATVIAHGSHAPAPTFPSVLLDWRFDPLALVLLVATAAAYLWAVLAVNRAHPGNPQPRIRTWLFISGLAAIGVALLSPIEAYEGSLFSAHMVQHLLLMLVAPPLLLSASIPPRGGCRTR
jgi:putative membrane protein